MAEHARSNLAGISERAQGHFKLPNGTASLQLFDDRLSVHDVPTLIMPDATCITCGSSISQVRGSWKWSDSPVSGDDTLLYRLCSFERLWQSTLGADVVQAVDHIVAQGLRRKATLSRGMQWPDKRESGC